MARLLHPFFDIVIQPVKRLPAKEREILRGMTELTKFNAEGVNR